MNWIGELPTDWKTVPVKRLAAIYNGATPKSGVDELWNGDINWFTPTDLDNDGVTELSESSRKLTSLGLNSCAAQIAPAGSVVLSSRAPVGSVGVTTLEAATNQGCRTLTPFNNYPPKLLANTLLAAREQLQLASNGTTFLELSTRALADFKLPVPPASKWSVLLDHLDRATTRIDALVAKKTRFIELLREKRQALIKHAVTKGLDRGAAMKDSGVEWLGVVPAHWDVVRGSAVFVECKAKNDQLVSENYLSLMANIGIIPYEEKGDVGNKKPEDVRKCKLVDPGDFVLNSMNYAIGSYGVSSYSGVCSPVYVVMKHRPEVADPKFLDLILSNPSYQNYAQSFGTGILDHRRAIGWDEIKVIRVPLPPLDEQAEIAAWTISRRDRVDTLISKTERSIELLREHRTALITAAVTGKIDLRPTA